MTLLEPEADKSAMESAQGRINGLVDGLALFGERPLLGWGPGNFVPAKHAVGLRLGDERRAHNLFGEVLGELGLAGIIILIYMGVAIYRCNSAILTMRKRAVANDLQPKKDLFVNIAWACNANLLLLFLLGNFGHNLYRYNWVVLCAISDLTWHYAALAHDNQANGD